MSRPLNNDALSIAGLADVVLPGLERQPVFKAVLAGDLDNLKRHEAAWQELAGRAIEPSMIAVPEWQLPMFEHMRGDRPQIDVLVIEDGSAPGRLEAVIPFIRHDYRWGVPLPIITSWMNDLFFLGVPLIGRDHSQEVILTALEAANARAAMFRLVPQSGPFAETLRGVARAHDLPIVEFDPIERAGLFCSKSFDDWFNGSFSRKRRKEYRRLRARLGEQGKLEFVSRRNGDPLQPWIDDFLGLEQAGWKGAKGTAVACKDDIGRFLDQSLVRFDDAGKLMFWKLSLDGKTVATLFGLIGGDKAWLIKIAYDEDFARYSPGVLLILDVTRELLERGDITEVDSSAVPDHPMINHVWRDRLQMTDIMIAAPGTSRLAFTFMAAAERSRRQARNAIKSVYHCLLKRSSK